MKKQKKITNEELFEAINELRAEVQINHKVLWPMIQYLYQDRKFLKELFKEVTIN